jgi:hypothetical protein
VAALLTLAPASLSLPQVLPLGIFLNVEGVMGQEIRELDRLVLTLMHEAGKAQGSSSDWDYYLCGLPAPEELGPPVLWDAHRLHSYCTQVLKKNVQLSCSGR